MSKTAELAAEREQAEKDAATQGTLKCVSSIAGRRRKMERELERKVEEFENETGLRVSELSYETYNVHSATGIMYDTAHKIIATVTLP